MRRAPTKTGDEVDAFSRMGKRLLKWRAGQRKRIKRSFNKKERKWLDRVLSQ